MSPFAIGDWIDTRFLVISASYSPTITYVTFSSVSSSTNLTVAPNLILSFDNLEISIISALESLSSKSKIRPSTKLCFSRAA